MNDLISRKTALERAEACAFTDKNEKRKFMDWLKYCLEQPPVEAVLVVRCKDCKHSDLPAVLTRKYGKIGTLTCHNRYSPCNNRNVNEKDFCSYGEMRTSAK